MRADAKNPLPSSHVTISWNFQAWIKGSPTESDVGEGCDPDAPAVVEEGLRCAAFEQERDVDDGHVYQGVYVSVVDGHESYDRIREEKARRPGESLGERRPWIALSREIDHPAPARC